MKSQKSTKFISIKIKTLNHSIFEIFANPNEPIFSIQGQIQQKTHVPVSAQRLLFRGINLETTRTLSSYQITQNSIISLIANKIPSQFSQNSSIHRSQINKIKSINKEHLKFKKHMAYQQRTGGFQNIKFHQAMEVLAQSKNQINQLLECVNYNYAQQNMPFRLEKRKMKVGEWVDVRDMSGQWAEAQIVNSYNEYVKIHYNGWPQRMNQWIPENSQRIMPFRSHTVQALQSNYLSPCPKYQATLKQKQNLGFQPQIENFINQLSITIDNFTKVLKDLELEQKHQQFHENEQNAESVKNMSNNAQNAQENIQNNLKDIDQVELDKKQEFYTPSKQIRANDNLSNKAQDDVSKCDKSDISNKSNKSFKSKRSQGLVDTQSMKSLIIDDNKKRANKIFFDNTEAQSVKSVKNQNHLKYHYYNQEYIVEESDSQLNDRQQNEHIVAFRKKQYKRKMKASQLAPLADRLGRLLVDLAPHFAMLGYQQQSINNFSQNLSTFTNQGSLQSKMAKAQKMVGQQEQKCSYFYEQPKYCQFQIPVMLTPTQISTLTRLLQEQKRKMSSPS